MVAQLTIRAYEPGDEAAIVSLFELVFQQPMPLAYWRWRFRENPADRIRIALAWDGARLVGHYAVSPVTVAVDGQDCPTALSMTTMTHPDYQGRGLFVTLAREAYDEMGRSGMVMVWGFPNARSHRGFVRDLGWTDIHEIPTFRRALAEGRPLPEPSAHIRALPTFDDDRFDGLWEAVKGRHLIGTRRDRRYLAWRYGANPEHRYEVLGYEDGLRLLGYAVFKRYENDLDVVDLLATEDGIGVQLVLAVGRLGMRERRHAVNMWLNFTLPLYREFERLGFQNSAPIAYFGAAGVRPGVDERIYIFRHWYLTMGDSDVY